MKYKNNPFNIRFTGSRWLGLIGNKCGFCEFESLDFGVRAFFILMRTYSVKYGINTTRSIISRFAPSSENDTKLYIKYVHRYLCLSPDVALCCIPDYLSLARCMAYYESRTLLDFGYLEQIWKYYHISTSNFC